MDTDKDRQGGDASSSQEQLAGVRNRIDAIDDRLLELLNERSRLSLQVGRIKAGEKSNIFKPQREIEILRRLSAGNPGPLPEKALKTIWREIFSSSRSLQRPLRVAFLGPEGTFSYFARRGIPRSQRYLPFLQQHPRCFRRGQRRDLRSRCGAPGKLAAGHGRRQL